MDPVNVLAKFEVRSFTRSWDNSGYLKTLGSPWIRLSRSWSSKVVDFGINRKRVCDFLLVRHRNLVLFGPFRRYCRFFCAPEWPNPYSTLILGVFPLHQIAHVVVSPRISLKISYLAVKLFSKYSNLCDHGTWTSQTDRQTDRRGHNRALRSIAR